MGARSRSKSTRNKVRAHRQRLRQQGLRPIQIWVPDMRSPSFAGLTTPRTYSGRWISRRHSLKRLRP